MSENIIMCENLVKIYKTKDLEVMALQGLDLTIKRGELMAIIGNSGSGKSTFLNMVGGLDHPSAGKLFVDDRDLFAMKEKQLREYKQNTVGFVWQNNARNLFPYLTALQNVELPMRFIRKGKEGNREKINREEINSEEVNDEEINKEEVSREENGSEASKREYATELLELVGMEHKKHAKLYELSGGEQQRIAIAIALANRPKLLLADEPTGAVDTRTSAYILDVFRKLNEEKKLSIVIVTHDRNLAKKVNRVVRICDGKVNSEEIMRESYAKRLEEIGDLEMAASHDTFAVLDKAGRVQLHKEDLEKIGVRGNKVRVEVEEDRIVIKAPD